MSDFNSSLPVRTQTNGDVVAKLVDYTTNTQGLAIDSSGRIVVKLDDGLGNSINSQTISATQWLQVVTPAEGPAAAGTAATYSTLAGGIYNSPAETLTAGQQSALQLTSSGALIVSATLPYDTNYGTVGANTLRTASQIGNATGAANFGAGATTAQTLRVASNMYDGSGNAISSTSGALNVSAVQSGTWTVQQGTAPWSFVGNLTNNNAAPAATNIGALVGLAEGTLNAARYTSGDQVLLVTDLAGNTNVDLQYYKGAAVSATNPMMVTLSDGTTAISGAVSAYGTAPVGTDVMGVNAYITNIPTVNQGTSPWIVKDQADGSASGGTAGAFSMLVGAIYNSTAPTLTTGQQASLQLDVSGNLKVDLATSIPAGANLIGSVGIDVGGNPVSNTNPVPVTLTTSAPGTAIQNYQTSAALAAGASVTLTYTVAATHTFNLERVWVSASGKIKAVVQNNGSTIFVGFNSTANTNLDITVISPPTIAAGNTVSVIITNNDLAPFDVYATIEGNQN